MNIRITIYNNKTVHAASYDPVTKEINLYCNSLKYKYYHADVVDYTEPTKENITCKKCTKKIGGMENGNKNKMESS